MNQPSYPVTIAVRRPDGSVEHVRVGTAVRTDEGFSLSLGELSIGALADAAPAARRPASPSGDGMVFPPYGRSKGAPIAGASMQDLEFYANGCRRTLSDPAKSRWHDKERVLLAAIEAEMARQDGTSRPPSGAHTGRGAQDFGAPPGDDDLGPMPDDDDIPF